jgi:hypothetical protein
MVHRVNQRAAVVIKPSTLLRFHEALKKCEYTLLYSSREKGKPGPKGAPQELIETSVEFKKCNPRFGCPRIAQQINKAFESNIDKDVVRRVLANHYYPHPDDKGPSWYPRRLCLRAPPMSCSNSSLGQI